MKMNIKEELLTYITEHFDATFDSLANTLKYGYDIKQEIAKDGKTTTMPGVGCGITYLKYRANSKKGIAIEEAARELRYNEVEKMFMSKFDDQTIAKYNESGFPLSAIWCQDYSIQNEYYSLVVQFARTKRVNMTVVSRLD